MNSRTYNAQFLTIDFRLLDDPGFCAFMRSAGFPVYMLLRRYIWRGVKKRHPVDKVNQLYRMGYLVTAVPRSVLARKLRLRQVSNVSRTLSELDKRGVIRKVPTGRENVYVLGSWEDRSLAGDGSYVIEMFLLERLYGAEPFEQPRLDDVAPGLSDDRGRVPPRGTSEVPPRGTSEVPPRGTSEVSKKAHINKEVNREANRPGGAHGAGRSVFEPVNDKERPDDVIYVEF